MEATLRRLGEVEIIPSPGESKFVHPRTIMYHLDGACNYIIPNTCSCTHLVTTI